MTLRLHELEGSPNNVRARLALGLKGLAHERVPIDIHPFPGDRSGLVAMSRQPLTPVLEHDGRVIFDSWAIMRYLEANFPHTPPLFSTDYREMHAIEDWELWARARLEEPVNAIFAQCMAPAPDASACRAASEAMNALTARIEDALATRAHVVRDAPSAADLACAPLVRLATYGEADVSGPISRFFAGNFDLGPGRERTRAWLGRVMAHLPGA